MKKWVWAILAIIVLIVAYYLVSPLWRVVEADEPSPVRNVGLIESRVIADELDTMDQETMKEFEEQMEEMKNEVIEMDDPKDWGRLPIIVSSGEFKPRAHEVEGQAVLIRTEENKNVLRFEDFETVNGPNLHIYLFEDLSSRDYIDLGPIKATKGNVNYEIPDDIDLTKYNKVAVWCVPFKVLFSYAELQ